MTQGICTNRLPTLENQATALKLVLYKVKDMDTLDLITAIGCLLVVWAALKYPLDTAGKNSQDDH